MKLNLGAGPHQLAGFINLNPPEWRWQDGLPYQDADIEAITISHMLMFVPLEEWPAGFAELARVLEPGGVVRITEDDAENPASERFGGHAEAVTITGPKVVRKHLKACGLTAKVMAPDESQFRDLSLCQTWHGREPKVFFMESVKPL